AVAAGLVLTGRFKGQEAELASTQLTANGVVSGTYFNPLQVGMLSWFRAGRPSSFAVGAAPIGVAFDGANMWVTNRNDGTVTKLRANDGGVLGTFMAGARPYGIAFDGANIWVTNFSSRTVTKLR